MRIKIQVYEEMTYVHDITVDVKNNKELEEVKKIIEESGHLDDFRRLAAKNGIKIVDVDERDDYWFVNLELRDVWCDTHGLKLPCQECTNEDE